MFGFLSGIMNRVGSSLGLEKDTRQSSTPVRLDMPVEIHDDLQELGNVFAILKNFHYAGSYERDASSHGFAVVEQKRGSTPECLRKRRSGAKARTGEPSKGKRVHAVSAVKLPQIEAVCGNTRSLSNCRSNAPGTRKEQNEVQSDEPVFSVNASGRGTQQSFISDGHSFIDGFAIHESDAGSSPHSQAFAPSILTTTELGFAEGRREVQTGEIVYTLNPCFRRFRDDPGTRVYFYKVESLGDNGTLNCNYLTLATRPRRKRRRRAQSESSSSDHRLFLREARKKKLYIVDEACCKLVDADFEGQSIIIDQGCLDYNFDWCEHSHCECQDNLLFACDFCPRSFHLNCLPNRRGLDSEGDWMCPECFAEANELGVELETASTNIPAKQGTESELNTSGIDIVVKQVLDGLVERVSASDSNVLDVDFEVKQVLYGIVEHVRTENEEDNEVLLQLCGPEERLLKSGGSSSSVAASADVNPEVEDILNNILLQVCDQL